MDFKSDLLERYILENPEIMVNVKQMLDITEGWRNLTCELQKFRVPVFFRPEVIGHNSSPSNFLINELIKRSCSIEDFKGLLRQCNQLHVLSLLEEPEPVKIVVQPGEDYEKMNVTLGGDLRLVCSATGIPSPCYQWYCDNRMLSGYNSSTINIPDFKEDSEGDYYCIVKQCMDDCLIELTSNVVVCSILSLPQFVKNPPCRIIQSVGTDVKIEVEIYCHSSYKIEWIFENQILKDETKSFLYMNVDMNDAGEYRCVARNSAGEVFSDSCELLVIQENKTKDRNRASAKVALLIANSRYENYTHLNTPMEDVLLLAEKLDHLKFEVITLIDLTLKEMHDYINWFFNNLPAEAYAFFCYIGHGFSLMNNNFMMPVDCPELNQYKMADCVLDELILKHAKEKKLKLLVKVLDMCLKVPSEKKNPDIFNEKPPTYHYEAYPKCVTVQAYATSKHQSAYESPNSHYGPYIDCICRHLEKDEPIAYIFETAHGEFLQNEPYETLQTPVLTCDLGRHSLTDTVEENADVRCKLLPFVKVKSLKLYHELYFPEVDWHTILIVLPHRGKILNAIDMKFEMVHDDLRPTVAFASPEVLSYRWNPTANNNEFFLTLFNIQKVKTNIYITVILTNQFGQEIAKSEPYPIDLGLPLIASEKVWMPHEK